MSSNAAHHMRPAMRQNAPPAMNNSAQQFMRQLMNRSAQQATRRSALEVMVDMEDMERTASRFQRKTASKFPRRIADKFQSRTAPKCLFRNQPKLPNKSVKVRDLDMDTIDLSSDNLSIYKVVQTVETK